MSDFNLGKAITDGDDEDEDGPSSLLSSIPKNSLPTLFTLFKWMITSFSRGNFPKGGKCSHLTHERRYKFLRLVSEVNHLGKMLPPYNIIPNFSTLKGSCKALRSCSSFSFFLLLSSSSPSTTLPNN